MVETVGKMGKNTSCKWKGLTPAARGITNVEMWRIKAEQNF